MADIQSLKKEIKALEHDNAVLYKALNVEVAAHDKTIQIVVAAAKRVEKILPKTRGVKK